MGRQIGKSLTLPTQGALELREGHMRISSYVGTDPLLSTKSSRWDYA